METIINKEAFRIDWKLVLLSLNYFIIYTLPAIILTPDAGTEMFRFLLLFMMLAVSLYTAYRSSGYTVFEPAIASVIYLLILYLLFIVFLRQNVTSTGGGLWVMTAAPLVAFVGAWFGERYQSYREKKST